VKLWLLRHAQVALPPGVCYGASDVPAHADLTQAAAEATAPLLPHGAPLWVSALGRAGQLAEVVHSLRPDLQPPHADARLNEMHFGQWEMQPWNAIPRNAFDAWMADFPHHRFGGTESTQQVIDRVASALQDLRGKGHSEAVWVTHAGVIRAVSYLALHGNRPIQAVNEWPVDAPAPGGHVCVTL
jgi:alpha-ribazole phosphatase